ncbi:MAG TPA: potassium-transporting ATPase subunit KdpB [Thermoplasmata archaeon]|nr:potassium-transporting ATPase subunit KdpB [Thermoplasmata archaeon]
MTSEVPLSTAVHARHRPHLSLRRIVAKSFAFLAPRHMARNPVMFVVWVLMLFTGLVTLLPSLFPDLSSAHFSRTYFLLITVILFLTVWFSSLSEAIAEAQGKAQAESLRDLQSGGRAKRRSPDGALTVVGAAELRKGDQVALEPNDMVPLDGDVIEGAFEIDESMMTGESAAVIRESGGDKTSVLGGSRILRGKGFVRITSDPGQSFLDRMIQLVESARRDRTPNELALNLVLAAFTLSLLAVVVTFYYLIATSSLATSAVVTADLGTLIALLVCLMPTTIGGLLPAVGIAAVNRVAKANVVAKSGRAVEAAGDLDVLILDKTGTITTGNRIAVDFIPAADADKNELMVAAALASAHDDTPEGRSVSRLAVRRLADPAALKATIAEVIPFSAERRFSGVILQDGGEILKGAITAIQAHTGAIPTEVDRAAAESARQGMTPLAISSGRRVLGIVVLKDVVKPGIPDRLRELRLMGIRTVMCTGDNRVTARAIAKESGVDEFIAEARPETKLELVERVKRAGRLVAMTGDGTNDAPALARADVGLAMNSGTSAAKEAGNMVDLDSDPTKIIEIVSLGKQLLITRGGLTTFSVTNDVAKYFAILPAMFVGVFGVGLLNILQFHQPHLAVLATLLFNALIIPIMIPIAVRGAPFRPRTAVDLLRGNILVYGLGGLLSAFAGIWLVYLGLQYALTSPVVVNALSGLRALLGS